MTSNCKRVHAGPYIVDRACYTDPEIFDQEVERIFEKSWVFIAQASELAEIGDYRTALIGRQPVIAIRGEDGEIRVFFNSCRHKATMLLTEKQGNCQKIRCPYHHWQYDTEGNLKSIPRYEAYGGALDMTRLGLVQVPRMGEVFGLVFASLDPDAQPLDRYIGDALPYLKDVALYLGEDMTTIGTYDYVYDGNWKLLMENTVDDYHAEYLHDYAFVQRAKVFGMEDSGGFMSEEGSHFSVELGRHGAFDQHDDKRTLVTQKVRSRRVYLNVFPSLIALYNPVWDVTGLRIMIPEAVDRTRVINYVLAPKSADSERIRLIGERFHYSWGPGGRAGVVDIHVFAQIQKGHQAKAGGKIIISRGHETPGPNGGPTEDHAVRAFWSGWREFMGDIAEPADGQTIDASMEQAYAEN